MAVSVLCLFLTVPWVGLQCVSVAFAAYTHLLFSNSTYFLHADREDSDQTSLGAPELNLLVLACTSYYFC